MNINEQRVIAAGPGEVWSVAGDAAAIADWVPALAPHPNGAEVTWTSEFTAATPEEEAQLAEAITGIYRAGLDDLASRWPTPSS